MGILEDLTPEVTASQLAAKLLELQIWLGELDIELDVSDPVLISVVLTPWATRLAEQENQLATAESLARVSSNSLSSFPPEHHEAIREYIADLHGVPKSTATYSAGEIRIVLRSSTAHILTAGTVFQAGSLLFVTNSPYILQTSLQANSNSTRLLRPLPDGNYWAIVPVVAASPGAAYNIVDGTALSLVNANSNVVTCQAYGNFVGGEDSNSLSAILESIRLGIFSRQLGTRDQIVAWLQNNPVVGGVRQVGVVGFGDPELIRDQHPFLPVQRAGLADIYLAVNYYPTQTSVTLDAVVTAGGVTSSTLKFSIGRDIAPGFFRIDSVLDLVSNQQLVIKEEARGLDMTPQYGQQIPELSTPYHGGFSSFQTADVTCEIALPNLVVGDSRLISCTLLKIVGLDAAQSLVSSRSVRSLSGDTLVRAAIPLLISVRIQLRGQFETLVADVSKIQAAVVQEIMGRPMRERLAGSDIIRAVAPHLPDDLSVSGIMFDADLILPDGTTRRITQNDNLDCPQEFALQLSSRTIAMYCSTANVQVSQDRVLAPTTP